MAKKMKAVWYEELGELDRIIIGELETPDPGEGEVLVRIKAAGVNPVDAAVVRGYLQEMIPHETPLIPGWDMAGVVEECGYSARRFKPGDEVYAYARRPLVRWGTMAEYITIPESYLSHSPENISLIEAGGIPLVGLTAYQSLYEAGYLREGQTVLILGASGGVGSMAIQLAKVKNARVIGVASENNHDYMKELGADEVIDYRDTDIGKEVKDRYTDGVDLIFDCASGKTLQQSLKALKKDGRLVSILNQGEDLDPDVNFEYVFVEPNARQLNHLRELAEEGKLNVHVSQTYSLDDAVAALKDIESSHTRGKMVISI